MPAPDWIEILSVCRGFAKDIAIIHSNCYLNLLWGEEVMLNTYQQALSSASYSKPNSSFIIMFRILFSFKILTIFSLNDWTKRQFRNLDKDSDPKSCPHFRFIIFVTNIINTNKTESTTNQLLLNVWFCVAWDNSDGHLSNCILGSCTFLQWVYAEVLF